MKHANVNDGLPLNRVGEFDFTGYIVQEKLDGWRAFLDGETGELIGRNSRFGFYKQTFPGWVFDGELMPDGEFIAFDVLVAPGEDVSQLPQVERLKILDNAIVRAAEWHDPIPAMKFNSGCAAFARYIEKRGGEGIVAKLADKPYGRGGWLRFKRRTTYDVPVISIQSGLADVAVTKLGKVTVPESVKAGDVIEVAAHSLHPSGLWREPRFIRIRKDKMKCLQ